MVRTANINHKGPLQPTSFREAPKQHKRFAEHFMLPIVPHLSYVSFAKVLYRNSKLCAIDFKETFLPPEKPVHKIILPINYCSKEYICVSNQSKMLH